MTDETTPAEPKIQPYRPLSTRRRWLILLLAVATAATIVLLVLFQPGAKRARPVPQPCRGGEQEGCVGGKADVILLPAASQAR